MCLVLLLLLNPAQVFGVGNDSGHLNIDGLVIGGADYFSLQSFHGLDGWEGGGEGGERESRRGFWGCERDGEGAMEEWGGRGFGGLLGEREIEERGVGKR